MLLIYWIQTTLVLPTEAKPQPNIQKMQPRNEHGNDTEKYKKERPLSHWHFSVSFPCSFRG